MQKRLHRLACFLVLLMFPAAWVSAQVSSSKKGVALCTFPAAEKGLKDLGATWYYGWASSPPAPPPAGIEFVPMIWGQGDVNPDALRKAKKSGHVLLAFNEPDLKSQAVMTVEQALELWPQLEATGMRLGSPSPATGADSTTSWFGLFMKGVQDKGLRVDFICIHRYMTSYNHPGASTRSLKDYLQRIYALYHKPIWITEFALANWKVAATAEQQQAFAKEVLPMLESLPYVERYAWFSAPPTAKSDDVLSHANLSNADGSPSELGKVFASAK